MRTEPAGKVFTPVTGQPVRFLAVEWREPWEFDHPTAVLEPVFRYSPNGTSPESMTEDAAIDICLDAEKGRPTRAGMHPSDVKEFAWRGWDVDELRGAAEAVLRGEPAKFGDGFVGVLEEYVVFRKTGNEIDSVVVDSREARN